MMQGPTHQARPRNRILGALPDDEYARITRHLEPVELQVRDLVHDIGHPITHVYFPNTGVTSFVSLMADGSAVETATIGYEGMVGLAIFHHTDRMAAQAFCQVPGDALRMSADTFRGEIGDLPALNGVLHRYTQAMFTQVSQASACNRLHPIRQRCARWLLQTHDRVGTDEFPLTQEFLAQMLGVRRASVSEVAAALQKGGFIEYTYGRIRIVDRPGLEHAACECYRIIVTEYDRLLQGKSEASPLSGLVTSDGNQSTVSAPKFQLEEMERGS
jgi:CRP-like cAMP-binding protein